MPVTPFQPLNLDKPGLKRARAKAVKPMVKSFALEQPQEPAQPPEVVTTPARRKYNKEELRVDVQYLSQRLTTYLLDGDRLERLMAETKLKDLGVLLGITTEKLLLLEGQPTQIISTQQHQKMDQVMPKLLEEMQRRGLRVAGPVEAKVETK